MGNLSKSLKVVAAAAALCASAGAAAALAIPAGHVRVLVTAKPGQMPVVQQALATLRARDVRPLKGFDIVGVTLPTTAVGTLKALGAVRAVDANEPRYLMVTTPTTKPAGNGFIVSPGGTYTTGEKIPYAIRQAQADQVSDHMAGNRKVCIIDSGYDKANPDLQKHNISGWTNGDAEFTTWEQDENSHGTHVAGTIAALDNGAGVVGVMPGGNISLHIGKVFSAEGGASPENILQAALSCRDNGANIISMSLGGPLYNVAEEIVYTALDAAGILVIAAAGNAGNTTISYPAGYQAVMSVGSLNEAGERSSYSQFNADVEISAGGENVLSTVPTTLGRAGKFSAAGKTYEAVGVGGPVETRTNKDLVDLGLAGPDTTTRADGKICLIKRGEFTFVDKVAKCESLGGVGAVIYNNVAGGPPGASTPAAKNPVVAISQEDGDALQAMVAGGSPVSATVEVTTATTGFKSGTSMSTPLVAGVAALVWSYAPNCTNVDVRRVLSVTAKDLGAPGRDPSHGHGLVQAKAARDLITKNCGR